MNGLLTIGSKCIGKINNFIFNTIPTPPKLINFYWYTNNHGSAEAWYCPYDEPNTSYITGQNITGNTNDAVAFISQPDSGYFLRDITVTGDSTITEFEGRFVAHLNYKDSSARLNFSSVNAPDGVIYFTQFKDLDRITATAGPLDKYQCTLIDNPIKSYWITGDADLSYYRNDYERKHISGTQYTSGNLSSLDNVTSHTITNVDGTMPQTYINEKCVPTFMFKSQMAIPGTYYDNYSISYWYKNTYAGDNTSYNFGTTIVRPFGMATFNRMEGVLLSQWDSSYATENTWGLGSGAPVSCYNGARVVGDSMLVNSIKYIDFNITPDNNWHYYTTEITNDNIVSFYRDGIKYADASSNLKFFQPVSDEEKHRYMVWLGSRFENWIYRNMQGSGSGYICELYVRNGIGSGDVIPTQPIVL